MHEPETRSNFPRCNPHEGQPDGHAITSGEYYILGFSHRYDNGWDPDRTVAMCPAIAEACGIIDIREHPTAGTPSIVVYRATVQPADGDTANDDLVGTPATIAIDDHETTVISPTTLRRRHPIALLALNVLNGTEFGLGEASDPFADFGSYGSGGGPNNWLGLGANGFGGPDPDLQFGMRQPNTFGRPDLGGLGPFANFAGGIPYPYIRVDVTILVMPFTIPGGFKTDQPQGTPTTTGHKRRRPFIWRRHRDQ